MGEATPPCSRSKNRGRRAVSHGAPVLLQAPDGGDNGYEGSSLQVELAKALPAFLDHSHATWLQADESTMHLRAIDKIPPRLLDRNIHGHFAMVEHEEH